MFNDESPGHTANSTLTSMQTPASALSTSTSRKDQLGSSTKNHSASGRVVNESSKVKKPRSLKPKVLKSSAKEPPPKSPLTNSVAVPSKTRQGRLQHESTIRSSSLAVHKMTAASLGRGRGQMGGAGSQEDKENTTPLPVAVPKAHDILAEQVCLCKVMC